MAEVTLRYRLKWRLISRIGGWILSSLMRFNRIEVIGREHLERAIATNRPVFVGFWHGRLIFAAWFLRKMNPTTLISRSDDGELIARVLERWGFRTIRGSSRRGAQGALRSMLRELENPELLLAVTMDGPLGPHHVPTPGSLSAAQRKNAVMLPLSGSATRNWTFHKSWDRFMLPKPFGKIVITIGEPVDLGEKSDEPEVIEKMASAATKLEEQADALTGTLE